MLRRTSLGQTGFTLIELILVMAISSVMLVIAFAGQRQLRDRARFDAQINKVVASVSDAHNQATAGVNIIGGGDGTSGCGGGPGGQFVFAGSAWTVSNGGASFVTIDFYKALPGVRACKFPQSQAVDVPNMILTKVNGVAVGNGARVLFVRNDTGGMAICVMTDASPNTELTSFETGTCNGGAAVGNVTLTVQDQTNIAITSDILIDKSGLAKRVN